MKFDTIKSPAQAWILVVGGSLFLLLGLVNVFINSDKPGTYLAFMVFAPLPTAVGVLSLRAQRRDKL